MRKIRLTGGPFDDQTATLDDPDNLLDKIFVVNNATAPILALVNMPKAPHTVYHETQWNEDGDPVFATEELAFAREPIDAAVDSSIHERPDGITARLKVTGYQEDRGDNSIKVGAIEFEFESGPDTKEEIKELFESITAAFAG